MVGVFRVSKQRACRLMLLGRSSFYWRSKAKDQTPPRRRIRELAEARPRFGYPRIHVLLRREGWKVNIKRVYRLYKLEGLGVRTKKRKKRGSHLRWKPGGRTTTKTGPTALSAISPRWSSPTR